MIFLCVVLPAQTESSLEKLSGEERDVVSTGETLAHTEQALRDLESLETKAQVGRPLRTSTQTKPQKLYSVVLYY